MVTFWIQRKDNGIVDEQGKVLPERKKKPRNRILGKATLARVWRDMEALQAPTSLTRAPPTIGSSGQGTISADEWRTFCTVNLPMTLIAMWGLKDKDSRERKLLDNFLDLVKAVNCASTRITTQKRRDDYSLHMKRHLQTMLELFPGTTITPNQHKALHQQECLSFLGPSHVLWCYGFERGNHELQKISTNNKICTWYFDCWWLVLIRHNPQMRWPPPYSNAFVINKIFAIFSLDPTFPHSCVQSSLSSLSALACGTAEHSPTR